MEIDEKRPSEIKRVMQKLSQRHTFLISIE